MFCLDGNSSRNDQYSIKKDFSHSEVPSFPYKQDTLNTLQPFNGSAKEEESEDNFNIYGQNNFCSNSTTFDNRLKPQYKFINSTSLGYLKCQSSPNNSTLSDDLKQSNSDNVSLNNKWSKHQFSCNTENNYSSFSNLKYQTRLNNSSTLYNSISSGYLKHQSSPNISNDMKHQYISNNDNSAYKWSNHQPVSTVSNSKTNCASFSNLNNRSSSDNFTVSGNLIRQTSSPSISSTSDWPKPQSGSNNFSSNDCKKFEPSLNNSIPTYDWLKVEPSTNDGLSTKWLTSDPCTVTSSATNDWLRPSPSLKSSAPTNDSLKYRSDADETTVYEDWLEPHPISNNYTVINNHLTSYPTSNNLSAYNDPPRPKSNIFVTNSTWLEPETNSNNSVTWLMPQPSSNCEMNLPHQQLKQECDTKPVLTELKTVSYCTRECTLFQDDIKFIPSPDFENIFKGSTEEIFKTCGLDDLIKSPTEDLLTTSDVDAIISNLNTSTNVYEIPNGQTIRGDTIIKNEYLNPVISMGPMNNMQSLKKTLNRKHFKCSQCIYNTNTREHLDEHINKLHCLSNICEYNAFTNNRPKSRNRKAKIDGNVLQERPVEPKSNVYLYKCPNCKYKTCRIDRYQKHVEENACKELSDMDYTWRRAQNTSNSNSDKENRQSKRSSTKNLRPKPNKCPQCSYSTHRSDCLQKHIEKVHSKSIGYKCNSCSFQSTLNKEYYEHMKRHYAGPPFVCDVCSYKSKLITAFVAHQVIHTGDRLFCCTLCDFSCKRKYHLKGHMISHSREKNFNCNFCFKKYSYKCSLVRHLKTACREYVPES